MLCCAVLCCVLCCACAGLLQEAAAAAAELFAAEQAEQPSYDSASAGLSTGSSFDDDEDEPGAHRPRGPASKLRKNSLELGMRRSGGGTPGSQQLQPPPAAGLGAQQPGRSSLRTSSAPPSARVGVSARMSPPPPLGWQAPRHARRAAPRAGKPRATRSHCAAPGWQTCATHSRPRGSPRDAAQH